MRNYDSDVASFLNQGEGIIPVTGFGFAVQGNPINVWYSDKAVPGMQGRILSCSNISSIMRLDQGGGGAGEVTVVLDNTDGAFEFSNLAAYVYQTAQFIQLFFTQNQDGSLVQVGDAISLFIGHISTPCAWDEKNRTITFTVTQSIISREAGYCIEDLGGFNRSDVIRLLGQPLPMIFGHVYHSPCVLVTAMPAIWTQEGFGIVDKTLPKQIAKLQGEINNNPIINLDSLDDSGIVSILFDGPQLIIPGMEESLRQAQAQADRNAEIMQEIQKLTLELNNQTRLAGSGNVPLALSMKLSTAPGNCTVRVDNLVFNAFIPSNSLSGSMSRTTIQGPGETLQDWIAEGFKYIRAGSRVQIVTPYSIWYIASCTPGRVVQVWAYRSVGGSRTLTPVPTQWYSIAHLGVATCVVLNMLLSARDWLMEQMRIHFENLYGKYLPIHINQPYDWEDDIYIEYIGTIGPSPIAILQWLLSRFNPGYEFGIDESGHYDGYVENYINRYKMHFMIQVKEDCIKLMQDIAYQCNSTLYLKNNTIYMKYWPADGVYNYTIPIDDVEYGSLKIETSNLDEIFTRYIATCRLDYSPNFKNPITFRLTHNSERYGIITESRDFNCYTTPAYAENAAAYWLALYSDVHTRISFRAMPWHIFVEAFDFVSTPFGNGLVYSATYNSDENVNEIVVDIYPTLGLGNLQAQTYWPDYQTIDPGQGGEPTGGEIFKAPDQGGGGVQYNLQFPDGMQQTTEAGRYFPVPESGFPIYAPDGPVTPFLPDTPPLPGKYTYKEFPPLQDPAIPHLLVGPCKIVRKAGGTKYIVDFYPSGKAEQSGQVTAEQLQIADDDTIPTGSWSFCVGIKDTKANKMFYYISFPVWLG